MARLGARVTAVDKAPLDAGGRGDAGRGVRGRTAPSASRRNRRTGCSAISSPIRRGCWRWCERWIAAGAAGRIVCTVKFQGETDHATAEAFAAIPGGRLMHLFHNKHELTFAWAQVG